MRWLVITRALVAATTLIACGGATPPANDETAATHDDSKASDSKPGDSKPGDSKPGDSKANDSTSAGAAAAQAPSPPSASPGDSSAPSGDDPWMASHQVPPKDVLRAVRPAQAKAQACFRAGVKRDPSTSGEVKIKFVISNDGTVRVWRDDDSSMSDQEVTQCVGELLKSLKFPKQKSPGDAYGTYTVNFSN
jgi:hypothetical protein